METLFLYSARSDVKNVSIVSIAIFTLSQHFATLSQNCRLVTADTGMEHDKEAQNTTV